MAVKASGTITLSSVVDVKACYRYYLLQSSTLAKPSKPTTNPPSSSWDDVEPTYKDGSTNTLYTVDLTVFSDNTWSYSEVSVSSSYEAAKSAYNKAVNAQNTANSAQESIDNMEIGGRNLILRSNVEISTNKYDVHRFVTSSAPIAGETYTITICLTPASGVTHVTPYLSGGNKPQVQMNVSGTGKQILTATFTAAYDPNRLPTHDVVWGYISLYRFPNNSSVTGNTTVHWIKLEKGNVPTDWTLAPEDMLTSLGSANLIPKTSLSAVNATLDVSSTNRVDIVSPHASWAHLIKIGRTYEAGTYILNATGSVSGKSFEIVSDVQIDTSFPKTTGGLETGQGYNYRSRCTLPYTFTSTGPFQLGFYIDSSVGAQTITGLKLEKGNRETDWSPAPEDMATSEEVSDAQGTATEALERVAVAEAVIQNINGIIAMMVTDGNGASLMTQTETGWTFTTASIQDAIDKASDDLDILTNDVGEVTNTVEILQQAVDDLGVISEYVKITTYEDEPCIELGEADSEFKLRITNTRIMFMDGENVVAYINNQTLHIKKATVEEELHQGGFVWKVRSNGNLGLTWKGVSS